MLQLGQASSAHRLSRSFGSVLDLSRSFGSFPDLHKPYFCLWSIVHCLSRTLDPVNWPIQKPWSVPSLSTSLGSVLDLSNSFVSFNALVLSVICPEVLSCPHGLSRSLGSVPDLLRAFGSIAGLSRSPCPCYVPDLSRSFCSVSNLSRRSRSVRSIFWSFQSPGFRFWCPRALFVSLVCQHFLSMICP